MQNFGKLSLIKKNHLPCACRILNLSSIGRSSSACRGIIDAGLFSMFLGLTQLKLRGHLLQAVDASGHQHHGPWVLDSRKLSLGLSHRSQIRDLLRYAEALGVGAAI